MPEEDARAVALEDVPLDEDPDDGKRYMKRCVACNHRSARHAEPVTTVRPGDEAIAAVAAQTLLEAMPERTLGNAPPMGGRSLLTFSDNRQDAAFFAPFLERISRVEAIRGAIIDAVRSEEDLSITNLAAEASARLKKHRFRVFDRGDQSAPLSGTELKDN